MKRYDLLVSYAGDITAELDKIRNVVETLNFFLEKEQAYIQVRHWTGDSCLQIGQEPQNSLCEQIIRNCDILLVIFWTLFGIPDRYRLGAEEKIAEAEKANKPVLLYFSDAPISPSRIDVAQLQKVRDFRNAYEQKKDTHYRSYTSMNEFGEKLLRHLLKVIRNRLQKKTKTAPGLSYRTIQDVRGNSVVYNIGKENLYVSYLTGGFGSNIACVRPGSSFLEGAQEEYLGVYSSREEAGADLAKLYEVSGRGSDK